MTTNPLADAPSAILAKWLEQAQPDTEAAAAFRRELRRREGERDELITEAAAAKILGVTRDDMRSIAERRLIRPIRELAFGYEFWRREIERWAAWTDPGGGHHAS